MFYLPAPFVNRRIMHPSYLRCFFNTNLFGILNDCNLLLLIKLLFDHIAFSFLLFGESVTFFQADFYEFLLS